MVWDGCRGQPLAILTLLVKLLGVHVAETGESVRMTIDFIEVGYPLH
jgi:hypothetical protein